MKQLGALGVQSLTAHPGPGSSEAAAILHRDDRPEVASEMVTHSLDHAEDLVLGGKRGLLEDHVALQDH